MEAWKVEVQDAANGAGEVGGGVVVLIKTPPTSTTMTMTTWGGGRASPKRRGLAGESPADAMVMTVLLS